MARTSREDKFAHPNIQLSFANLRKDATAKYQPLVERAASGSKDALIKLMCAQCMGWSGMEKACEADGTNQPPCALYPLNLTYWPKRANPERFTYDPMSKK